MGKYPIYAIVAIVFIGMIKLLQVTTFDVEQYNKNKKLSFSKPESKAEIPYKKGTEEMNDKEILKDADTLVKKEETPLLSVESGESEQPEQAEATDDFAKNVEESTFETPKVDATKESYANLSDLKNRYLAPKIANLPPGQLREDVVIRYYRHDQDGEKVYILKELGYYIHEKEANETVGLGSNVVYYGSDVSIEDVQIVAYTLLEKGLPIKALIPSQFSWKSNSIEIGTDTLLLDNTILSMADIKNFSK
ncbi:hypothetical protein [Ekhidna sp.]|uniref:hypothetical protein n=1 Tax=Ekhidna sp. TaxID=2608089 RepID=UPI003297A9CC